MGVMPMPVAIAPNLPDEPQTNPHAQLLPAELSASQNTVSNASDSPGYFQSTKFESYRSPYAISALQTSTTIPPPVFSKETSEVIARVKANGVQGLTHGSSEWETAKQAVKAEMDSFTNVHDGDGSTNASVARTGGRRGRGPRRRGSPTPLGTTSLSPYSPSSAAATPPSSERSSRGGRPRGRGGRPRGSGSRGSGRGRGRGGSLSAGKRKRGHGSDSDNDGDLTDSSEEITALPQQSRSGRKIFQASTNVGPVIKIEDLEPERPSLATTSKPVGGTGSPLSMTNKKKVHRRAPKASDVCKNCGRGHSPLSNAIVFCDGCNTPWHQYCHDPPIKPEYLLIPDKEWFCSDCLILREDRVKLEGKVAGEGMSLAEKRKYFRTLTPSVLVSLLIHATSLHPNLPLFPPKPPLLTTNGEAATAAGDSAVYYYDENAELPYPKAGNGLPLPPESDDLGILVEDVDDAPYVSHRWGAGIVDMIREAERAAHGTSVNLRNGASAGGGGGNTGLVSPLKAA